jgi:hypothetical protein
LKQKWNKEHLEKVSKWKRDWEKKNPTKHRLQQIRYKENNRNKINKNHREYMATHKETQRDSDYKKNYGKSLLSFYDENFDKQNGVCYLCGGINRDGRRLFIDHNHKTGKLRKLLCNRCNFLVGTVENNAELLVKIYRYLEEHRIKYG